MTASRVLGIGRRTTYELIRADRYPLRLIERPGGKYGTRYRVSKYDLLRYLGADRTAGDAP
jgi:hypothetical protein